VTLQVIRDWVLWFNAEGPEGLIGRKARGQPPRLKDEHRAVLAEMVENGPIPAVHGVVRWRIIDLCQWVWDEFAIIISPQTLSRELRAMGYRKLSAPTSPCSGARRRRGVRKTSRAVGKHRAQAGGRSQRHRNLVRRRSQDRSGERLAVQARELAVQPWVRQHRRCSITAATRGTSWKLQPWTIMSIGLRDWVYGS
jgi:homeodomain-containing protein